MYGFTVAIVVVLIVFLIMAIIPEENEWGCRRAVSAGMAFICLLVLFAQFSEVVKAKNSAEFYNKNFKTNYTAEEVFWNGETISKQILGEKHNININK
jgi:Na+/melibiose symporter-like transporter